MNKVEKENAVPVWNRALLTVDEAVAYTGIGTRKLKDIVDNPELGLLLWVGNKRMIKRKKLDEYLENTYSL